MYHRLHFKSKFTVFLILLANQIDFEEDQTITKESIIKPNGPSKTGKESNFFDPDKFNSDRSTDQSVDCLTMCPITNDKCAESNGKSQKIAISVLTSIIIGLTLFNAGFYWRFNRSPRRSLTQTADYHLPECMDTVSMKMNSQSEKAEFGFFMVRTIASFY